MASNKKPFFTKKFFRLVGGVVLGGFAGLSLTSSILPGALSFGAGVDSIFARWQLSEYAAHTALVWAMGGWAVVKTGIPLGGALILGLLGLASGVLLALGTMGNDPKLLLVCAIAGGFYGCVGGLLISKVLGGGDSQVSGKAE